MNGQYVYDVYAIVIIDQWSICDIHTDASVSERLQAQEKFKWLHSSLHATPWFISFLCQCLQCTQSTTLEFVIRSCHRWVVTSQALQPGFMLTWAADKVADKVLACWLGSDKVLTRCGFQGASMLTRCGKVWLTRCYHAYKVSSHLCWDSDLFPTDSCLDLKVCRKGVEYESG